MKRLEVSSLAGLLAVVLTTPAHAHLDLTDPPPRLGGEEGGSELKTGPCGQRSNGRTSTVTVFEPGETITVAWDEYINHPSYYRIAFDVDGDDDFPIRADMDDVVRDGDDPASVYPIGDVVLMYVSEPPDLPEYSVEVTLPNVECENCTLQVLQFMYDKLGDGRDNEYYFQCADIALRAGGGSDAGSVDSGTPGVDSGTPPVDSGSPGTDSGTPGTDSGTPGTDAGSGGGGGGCAVGGSSAEPLFALLAFAWLRRRR